ncbi:MAG: MBL fold metallo-hydrolase [Trueperaceae bacterium]|nr:MBL fold metallo-hydrolase [Trueperaceae bacterium]
MKLTFLGTRANTDVKSSRHRRHSALMVSYYGQRIMIDCGADWRGSLTQLRPDAIVVTHAHPDHAFGLDEGAPCPVYAPEAVWSAINDYPIDDRRCVKPQTPQDIGGLIFEAFPVDHSVEAPAVGYRITAGRVKMFYVPDVVHIHDAEAALEGVRIYIGDGTTMSRPQVDKTDTALVGHTPVRAQLTWCNKFGISRAYFTHCGDEVIRGDQQKLAAGLDKMANDRKVDAKIAYDGMKVTFR